MQIRLLSGIAFAILMIACGPVGVAQQIQYDQHLHALKAAIPDWISDLARVDVDRLNISYKAGKVLQEEKDLALQNVNTALGLTTLVLQRHRLSDEINLFAVMNEVQRSYAGLGSDLLSLPDDAAGNKMAVQQSDRLAKLANEQMNPEVLYQFQAITKFADAVQENCR